MAESKKYYWLKMMRGFFKRHDIQIIENYKPNGKEYVLFYVKLMLESIDHEGTLRFSEELPYDYEMLSAVTDTEIDIVEAAMNLFIKLKIIEILDDDTIFLPGVQKLIGSETAAAERMRKSRSGQLPQPLPKTNAERQKSFRAKKACEEKQHIPFIEDYMNKKRYGGNYYIVIRRDKFKCAICESIENICVHHIDGYDIEKPENNAENKLVTLCRSCHAKTHNGKPLPSDLLESIDYFAEVTEVTEVTSNGYTEKEKEKEINKDLELKKERKEKINKKEKNCEQVASLFNSLCPSLPSLKVLSDSLKNDIADSLEKYSLDDLKLLFKKAEASPFLKGENEREWVAGFDWLIKADNIAKVLNGNFDSKTKYKANYSIELFEQMLNADDEPPKTMANDQETRARAEALKKQLAGK